MARSTKHAFAFVWVTVLLDMVGLGLIMPILPELLRELTGSDVAHASIYGGWLFFAYALMQFFCAPIIGGLSDAFGRRPVLLLAVLGLGVDYALTLSCYDPSPDGHACGHCDSCQLRRRGFAEAGVPDPTRYAAPIA